MTTPLPMRTSRDASAFPLALAGSLLAVSVLTAIVVGVVTPVSGMTTVEKFSQWLSWFCGVGLVIAINVALAATVVARRGPPARFAIALVAATLTFYAASFLLSLARGWTVRTLVETHPQAIRPILDWMPFASLLQMLLVAALSLAVAWRLGGRGTGPVVWSTRSRRVLGAIVAFTGCLGLLPLQGRLMAMLDLVSLETLQLGLPFLALSLGLVHALLWLLAPVRTGSGVWPALVSSALIGPLLLAIAWLSQFILGGIDDTAMVSAVASVLLLACPVLAWALGRAANHRRNRANPT